MKNGWDSQRLGWVEMKSRWAHSSHLQREVDMLHRGMEVDMFCCLFNSKATLSILTEITFHQQVELHFISVLDCLWNMSM